jgi:translation elongation factor EF-G
VQCPDSAIGAVYALLNRKRGVVIEESHIEGTLLNRIKAYMPVNESSGFTDELRDVTSGRAFQNSVFDHWQVLPGDPLEADSRAGQVCRQIRIACEKKCLCWLTTSTSCRDHIHKIDKTSHAYISTIIIIVPQ